MPVPVALPEDSSAPASLSSSVMPKARPLPMSGPGDSQISSETPGAEAGPDEPATVDGEATRRRRLIRLVFWSCSSLVIAGIASIVLSILAWAAWTQHSEPYADVRTHLAAPPPRVVASGRSDAANSSGGGTRTSTHRGNRNTSNTTSLSGNADITPNTTEQSDAAVVPADSSASRPRHEAATESNPAARQPSAPPRVDPRPSPPVKPKRPAPPTQARQKVLLGQLAELYPDASLTTRDERLKAANKFFELGSATETEDDEQFVLLRRAMELSADAGEMKLLTKSVDRMARKFDVDAPLLASTMLTRAAEQGASNLDIKAFQSALQYYTLVAKRDDDYRGGLRVIAAARSLPTRKLTESQLAELEDERQRLTALAERFPAVEEAHRAVKTNWGDGEAHRLLGMWYYFDKNDPMTGRRHLKYCSRPDLKEAARLEDHSDHLATANAWWEIADSESDAELKEKMFRRAYDYYKRVNEPYVRGLAKVEFQRRRDELAARFSPADVTTAVVADDVDDDRYGMLFDKVVAAARERRYGDVQRYADHCVRLQPDAAAALNNQALANIRLGRTQQAVRAWEKALEQSAPLPMLLHNLTLTKQMVDYKLIPLDRTSLSRLEDLIKQAQSRGGYHRFRHSTGWLYASDSSGSSSPIEDRACLACMGKGKVECPVRGCRNGKVSVNQRYRAGVNPITGAAIYANRSVSVRCDGCYGRGELDCPRCSNGSDPSF